MRVPYRKDDENIQMMGKVFFLSGNMLFAAAAPRAPRGLPFGLGNLKTNKMGMRTFKSWSKFIDFFSMKG